MPRGMSTGLPTAPTLRRRSCATTRKASAASSSIRSCRRPIASPANWWNARAGFDNLFQACAAETACNAAHPRLEETFTGLVNKLEAEPLTTTVSDPTTGKNLEVVLDGGALVDWLRNQNYGVPMLQAAPDRIDGLAAGRPEAIAGDRHGSGKPGATTRSGCPCPRLRAGLWRQLSRKLSVRDAGGTRGGRPGSVSGLSRSR